MKTLLIVALSLVYTLSFSQKLEAIIIVAHIEDNIEEDTIKGSMYQGDLVLAEKESAFLESKGVTVHKFYGNDAKFKDIVKVSSNCSFFIYRGHGSKSECLSLMRETPIYYTDPITKKKKEFYYDNIDSIRMKELKLKKNSIVILNHVCFSAGSSASDRSEITNDEAKKRTEMYINSFFNCGASSYFSNNYSSSIYKLLVSLYEGGSISSFLNASINKNKHKEEFNIDYKKSTGIKYILYSDQSTKDKYKEFDICVCSLPNFSLNTIKGK
jgi:hypothetical protein